MGGTLSGDTHRYWLKFDLTTLPDTVDQITSATLTLTAGRKSTLAIGVGVGSNDSWDPSTLTWATQPAFSTPSSVTNYTYVAGAQYAWDVTAQIAGKVAAGDALASLVLAQEPEGTKSANVWFYTHTSAPSDALRPTLCIRYTERADTPPEVKVGEPTVLWPPNHKWRTFDLADLAEAVDAEDGPLDLQEAGEILAVTSSEPADLRGLRDGRTKTDVRIVGPTTVQLRAERDWRGEGRTYTIRFRIADSDGGSVEATAEVRVPRFRPGSEGRAQAFWEHLRAFATSRANACRR